MRGESTDDSLIVPGERGRRAIGSLRESFVDGCLGPWSSHPRTSVRRIVAVRRLGSVVVAAVVGYCGWRIYQVWTVGSATSVPGKFIDSASQLLSQRGWMLVAIAASLSATLTAGLTIRASLARGTAAPSRSPAVFCGLMLLFVAAAIAICMLVAWTTGTKSIGTSVRWWVLVGAMTPVSVLLFWFGLFPRQPQADDPLLNGSRLRRAGAFWTGIRSAVSPAVLAASSLLLSPDIARPITSGLVGLLASIPGGGLLGKIASVFSTPIAKVLGASVFSFVGMAAVTAVATLAVSRVTSDVRAAATGSVPRRASRGVFRSLASWTGEALGRVARIVRAPFRRFGRDDAAGAQVADAGGRMPGDGDGEVDEAFAGRLQAAIRERADPACVVEFVPGAVSVADGEAVSSSSADDGLDWLFGGRRPSADQVAILEAFEDRWREHAQSVEIGEFGSDRRSHADLFIESAVDRATLSSTLRACAIFACVARGQRVLFLVADDSARQQQVEELRSALSQLRFDALYRVGTLEPAEVAEWCPAPGSSAGTQSAEPPDIVVATPGDYDRTLLSGTFDHVLVRSFLLSIEVLFVDGLQRLTARDSWLLHLPFLIDKHRLVLRNENRAMQLVIGSAPVSDEWSSSTALGSISRQRIATRLFGGDSRVRGHFLRLRPTFRPRPTLIRLRSGSRGREVIHAEVLKYLAGEAGTQGVVALRGEHDAERSDIAQGLDPLAVEGVDPEDASATDPNAPDSVGTDGAGARGSRASDMQGPRFAGLRAIQRSPDTVLEGARFVVMHALASASDRHVLGTILAGRPGCVMVEFVAIADTPRAPGPDKTLSALPVFVSPGAPAMFLPHLRSAVPAMRADAPVRREDLARFGLSWDEERWRSHAAAMSPARLSEGWHLQTDGEIAALGTAGDGQYAWPAVFLRREAAVRWTEVRPDSPPDEGLCLLREQDRLELGRDVVHVDSRRFAVWMSSRELWLGTTDLFQASELVLRTDRQEYRPMLLRSSGGATHVEAEPRALEGDDLVIPKTFTSIVLPPDIGIDGPYAVRGARAFLLRVREQAAPLVTEETIVGLVSPAGQEIATQQVAYSVHASVTLVGLGGETPNDGSDVSAWLRASYEGTWTTKRPDRRGARETWPLMGHAVRVALGRCAPDLLRFARVFAFRPPMGHSGATLMLLESAATAGSAIDAFRTLLDDADVRRAFVAALREGVLSAPERIPCVGSQESPEQSRQSREDALRVIEELVSEVGWAPPDRPEAEEILGRVEVVRDGDPRPPSLGLESGVSLSSDDDQVRWRDRWLEAEDGGPVEFGVQLPFGAEDARALTESYGWRLSDPVDNLELLKQRCVRLAGARTIGPDYEAMIRRCEHLMKPLASRLSALADRCGLESPRDRVRLFAGFVQSTTYVVQRAGDVDDGFHRFGVQLPVETVAARAGDCDSSSLLLVALLRAGGVAAAGLMLVETEDSGHAMAAIGISPCIGDHAVCTAAGTFVLVECTGPHPIGSCSEEYVGRHVRIVALA